MAVLRNMKSTACPEHRGAIVLLIFRLAMEKNVVLCYIAKRFLVQAEKYQPNCRSLFQAEGRGQSTSGRQQHRVSYSDSDIVKQKLGDFIRRIDYFNAKNGNDYENSEDNPSNQLIEIEKHCGDITFDELKDAYTAFEEKVCVEGFPERHSPAYWIAYSTVCVLDRLTRCFLDDHKEMALQMSAVMTHALAALIMAGPTTTHTELFDKMRNKHVEQYAKTLGRQDLLPIMSAAKVTFKYVPNDDCNEHYYGYFQLCTLKKFFLMFSSEQYKEIQKEFLDIYIYYHTQLPGLPQQYAQQIDNLLREMTGNFIDNNPYLNLKGSAIIKSHIRAIQETVSSQGFTEESPVDTSAQRILKHIFKAVLADGWITDVFSHLIDAILELHKSATFRKEGKNIYSVYIYQLFRSFDKSKIPVSKLLKDSVRLVTTILPQGHMTPEGERLLETANDCVVKKTEHLSQEDVKTTLPMVNTMVASGRKCLIRQAEDILEFFKKAKALDWKTNINEAKKILDTIGRIPKENIQDDDDSDLANTISAYRSFMRELKEQLKKAKVFPQIQSSVVDFIFKCMTISSPVKSELAEEWTGRETLDISKEDTLRLVILKKCEEALTSVDLPLKDRLLGTSVSKLLRAVVDSYEGNGKRVTEEENKLFMSIINTTGKGGESVVEHFYEEEYEEIPNYKMMIWLNVLLPYAKLHQESATLSSISSILPDVIRWARIALVDDHEDMMNLCFGVLNWMGIAAPIELKSSLSEIMDLMLESGKFNELYLLVNTLYPHNPDAIHSKLQKVFDRLVDMKDGERRIMTAMFHTIAQKHPEAFTETHISTLLNMCKKGEDASQLLFLLIIKSIAEKCPNQLVTFMPQLCDGDIFKAASMNLRSGILACIGGLDETLGQKVIDYLMKYVDHSDPTISQIVMGTVRTMARQHKDYMRKYKKKLENLEQSSTVPQVRDFAHDIILVLEGKSVENIAEDIQQQKEDLAELDIKVGSTIDTVITIGDKVIEHEKDIGQLQKNLSDVDERVEQVEENVEETKIKIEEIDNKTITNAPKWSRDLTKLLNSEADNDWRLLARRLGYSNDDIRGWATQHDPCMALLSEWYATHKTSEASYSVLTALTEMNRMDGVAIVENAMKAAEGIVEDEEFEYPNPPPVFISYQWGLQNEVKLLKRHLNMAGYESWMDIGQMGGGDKLFAKIDNGIRGAKVVICCVTEKYAQSPNCNREVNLSVSLNKPIIPLLMEKMDWPPKGAMGPIFSEYLFIRFFQRGGEETPENDQRFWPVPKFQELLMQLNYLAVPDEKMVQKEYFQWWVPIVEEIVVDKNKTKRHESTPKEQKGCTQVGISEQSPLVFLSYQWGKQLQVKALYQRLTSLGLTVWMDIYQMGGGDSLYDKIDKGMRGCKAVVSCVTQKYTLSANCRREISLADALKKPIIPLLMEQIKWPPDGPMSMVFTELLYINFYKDEDIQMTWKGEQFNELIRKLSQFVPDIFSASSRKGEIVTINPSGDDIGKERDSLTECEKRNVTKEDGKVDRSKDNRNAENTKGIKMGKHLFNNKSNAQNRVSTKSTLDLGGKSKQSAEDATNKHLRTGSEVVRCDKTVKNDSADVKKEKITTTGEVPINADDHTEMALSEFVPENSKQPTTIQTDIKKPDKHENKTSDTKQLNKYIKEKQTEKPLGGGTFLDSKSKACSIL